MGWSGVANTGIALTCLAMLFEAVGFSVPFWFAHIYKRTVNVQERELGLYVNVWYTMSCTPGDTGSCKSVAIKPNFTSTDLSKLKVLGDTPEELSESAALLYGWSRPWQVIQIITTVGMGMCLLATLIMVGARCTGSHKQCSFMLAAICLIVSGFIAIGISCYTAFANVQVLDFLERTYVTGHTFPYSLLIFGLGGVICLGAVLALGIVACNWDRYGAYREDDKNSDFDGEPMSRISSSRDRGHDNPRYGYDQPRRDHSERDRQRYDDRYAERARYDEPYRYGYDMGNTRTSMDYDYGRSTNVYGQSRRDDMYRPYYKY